jgi:hypothetical protein
MESLVSTSRQTAKEESPEEDARILDYRWSW